VIHGGCPYVGVIFPIWRRVEVVTPYEGPLPSKWVVVRGRVGPEGPYPPPNKVSFNNLFANARNAR